MAEGDIEEDNPTSGGGTKGSQAFSVASQGDSSSQSQGRLAQGGTDLEEGIANEIAGGINGDLGDAAKKGSSPWKKVSSGEANPEVSIIDGVASIQIPEEIFNEAELLWKSYVVGYFIGDAPHVGSIHAMVNRIWSSPKACTKIDVQFIEKNIVLFRIERSNMRDRVIKRKYWHIADVPLVVSMWTPESALHPPELSGMPLWVDIRGVPNDLFSHKGLKCLSREVGGFVKLHPHTERCVRLDVARILIEMDLHKPLVEKFSFKDKQGSVKELEVSFPWLPTRCNVCQSWGYKGVECKRKGIVILKKSIEVEVSKTSAQVPGVDINVQQKAGNGIEELFHELNSLTPIRVDTEHISEGTRREPLSIQLIEPTTEVFAAEPEGNWTTVHGVDQTQTGLHHSPETSSEKRAVSFGSPSRFSPLMGIEEEREGKNIEANDQGSEEGEITDDKVEEAKVEKASKLKGKQTTVAGATKASKRKVIRAKDLILAGATTNSKKTSVRKL